MRLKEYLILLWYGARKRHRHVTEKEFMVQLEIQHQGVWKTVLCYDTSHGFSHVDRYNNKGQQKKDSLDMSFEEALTYADLDINENWEKYKERFIRGQYP
jgi:hypothetical protein